MSHESDSPPPDCGKLIPPVATLLRDLFRHHAIMNFSAPPPALRAEWVDAIFMPLVRVDQARGQQGRRTLKTVK